MPKLDGTGFPAYPAIRAALDAPVFKDAGIRKIVQWIGYETSSIPPLDLSELGYTKAKMTALKRTYFNPIEADRVKALLKRRHDQSFTSVAMSMRGGVKDSRSMGWCMESMVISCHSRQKQLNVGMLYRSTELTLKFSADLVFLPWVFEQLEIEPTKVRFHFANAYFSGIYYPILFNYWEPVRFLRMLRRCEPRLFRACRGYIYKMAADQGHHFAYGQQKLMARYGWNHYPEKMKDIRDYMEPYVNE